MKIEVTFDKSAKKQFRDQCIKRLQNFVSQIKGKTETPNTRRQSIINSYEQSKISTERDITHSILREPENNRFQNDQKESKSFKKPSSLSNAKYIGKSQNKGNVLKQNRIQNKTYEQQLCPVQSNKYNQISISLMKDKVNQILQKLQKNERKCQEDHQDIEDKLQITNRKLDYLIQFIERRGIIAFGKVDNSDASNHHQHQERCSPSFEQKFNDLTNKYYQIKQRTPRQSISFQNSIFSKSITSLQQTQDSVTFRHN